MSRSISIVLLLLLLRLLQVDGMRVDAILRGGIRKFTDEVRL